jgi:multidrug efflux system membrane fusion protein
VGTLVWIALILTAAAVGAYFYFGKHGATTAATETGKKGGHGHGADQIRVVVATATRGDIGDYLTGLGTVTPLNTDIIQSRVSGQLMKVLFTEGQMVNAGDLLVQIDTRPYDVQLAQDMAQKEHDEALLENAMIDLQRYQTLWSQNSIPQQTLATQESLVKQDQGTVDSDQALIDSVKLNITYCNITAPISGRVGLRLIDVGNYVQATGTTGLLVITQIQPITVIFTIPEDSIQSVVTQLNAGQKLPVDAYTRGGFSQKLASGTLLTLDNQVDPTTGTVKLRASFPNTDDALFPNQFVNTKMLVDTQKNVVLVPVAAVQHGNNGTFVYEVDTDANTVKMQTVEVGTVSLDGTNAEIKTGVSEGDTVVIDGVDKLQNGSKIIISKPNATGGHGGAPSTPAPAAPSIGSA